MKQKKNILVAILFLAACCFIFSLSAQNKKLDSLQGVLNSSRHDTLKVRALNEIARLALSGGNFEKALEVCQRAKDKAAELSSSTQPAVSQAGKKAAAKAYNNCGIIYYSLGKFSESITNYKEALQIRSALGDKKGVGSAYGNIGLSQFQQGNYEEALKNHFLSLKFRQEVNDASGIGTTLDNIGICYLRQGKNPEALKYLLAGLKKRLETGEKGQVMDSYNNLGTFFESQMNLEKAREYFELTLKEAEGTQDPVRTSHALANIGNLYTRQEKYHEALEKFSEAYEIMKGTFDSVAMASTLSNIGIIYYNLKNYAGAIQKQKEALAIRKKRSLAHGIALCEIRIAEASLRLNDLAQAKKYCKEAFETARAVRDLEQLSELNALASQVYETANDYQKSFDYYKTHVLYKDSFTNEENTKKIVQQQMQYDFDKKSAADSIKNAEAKRIEEINHKLQIRNQKLYTYAGLGGFLIMIVIAAISFAAFRNKKKANIEIAKQKHIVEEKQKEILDSIYYARRIQQALITNEKYIENKLNSLKRN